MARALEYGVTPGYAEALGLRLQEYPGPSSSRLCFRWFPVTSRWPVGEGPTLSERLLGLPFWIELLNQYLKGFQSIES